MPITIVAATEAEILPTIRFLSGKGFEVQGNKIQLLITGVGLMAATYSLTRHTTLQKPHLMIQAGIAGSFSEQLPILSTVVVADDGMGDLGAEEQGHFKDIFDLHLADQNNFPFTDRRLENPTIDNWQTAGFKAVHGITVNEISTRESRIQELKKKYQADLESMEGAAIHYVCLQEKISFVQLRCISNFVGERDKKNWKLKESIEVLNESLIQLIQESL